MNYKYKSLQGTFNINVIHYLPKLIKVPCRYLIITLKCYYILKLICIIVVSVIGARNSNKYMIKG